MSSEDSASTSPAVREAVRSHLLGDDTSIVGLAKYIIMNDIRKILVLTGAGVSVAAGIPDFRSPSSGIYANLGKYDLDEPTDAFSVHLLRERPDIFYDIAREMDLWPGKFIPTPIHYFIKLLADEGRLLRCCTQNIDGLERAAGLPEELLVEAHGSFSTASCIECHRPFDAATNRKEAFEGVISHCADCGGIVKPDVVFFGEQLPERFFDVLTVDTKAAQMVIVIGTSLQVHPFAALPLYVSPSIPRVVINMERVGGRMFCFPQDEELGDGIFALVTNTSSSSSGAVKSGDAARDGARSATPHASAALSPACDVQGNGEGAEQEMHSIPNYPDYVEEKELEEDEEEDESGGSSSDGYAQYGDYDTHPTTLRDVFYPGDCQASIMQLAELLGLGGKLLNSIHASTHDTAEENQETSFDA